MGFLDTVGRLIGRVEVALAGAEGFVREGEEALAQRDAMRARAAAHAILARVPGSPVGLALLADACELGGLKAELLLTLEELSEKVAERPDVWVRLGRARSQEQGGTSEARDAFVRALAIAEGGTDARREALLALADLDLAAGDGARAELWLERLVGPRDPVVSLRWAEARLLARDADGAMKHLATVGDDPTDGRGALARGRALAMSSQTDAFSPLLRAYVLEVPGASEALSAALAWIPSDDATRARVRTVVEAQGEASIARFRAAFARAEGRPDEARIALEEAVAAGDFGAARPLLDAALDDEDPRALSTALGAIGAPAGEDATVDDARKLPSVVALTAADKVPEVLDRLATISAPRVLPWAKRARAAALAHWLPDPPRLGDWDAVLARLHAHARDLAHLDGIQKVAELTQERARPVRVAIVGEFNAGKSTFINALIGADVAPTGVLPTTATLHHLRYAQDPIARILFFSDPETGAQRDDRLLPLSELRPTLKSLDAGEIRRVEILVPLASLTRAEILDTPGFNAPDPRHTEAAKSAFVEADAVIWLLDAGQALKQSEKRILDEARAAKVPVQILVNKADRMAPEQIAKVLASVDEGLAEAGLTSWSPVVALSARLALQGKLGDQDALARSGWARVQELMDTQIIGKSDDLKERALRRRALRLIDSLLVVARAQEADEARALAEAEARAQAAGSLAAKLDGDADARAQMLLGALSAPFALLDKDLEAASLGREREATDKDPVIARYRIDRAVARLSGPMAEVLSRVSAIDGGRPLVTEGELTPFCRTLLRGFAAADARDRSQLARAAIAVLAERLSSAALARAAPARSARRVDELEAMAERLA